MARPVRKITVSANARIVMDWLVHKEPRVYDFTEVATGCGLKRAVVERALNELRAGRSGGHLKSVGPDGLRLRQRHAYLPADAEVRRGFPKFAPVLAEVAEHPTVKALRLAKEEKAEEAKVDEKKRQERSAVRAQAKRQEKLDRRLSRLREAKKGDLERDEATLLVPTVDEIVEAGYSRAEAEGLVAEQKAKADGKGDQEAADAGEAARARYIRANPVDEAVDEAVWTSDEDVERALGEDAAIVLSEVPAESGGDLGGPTLTDDEVAHREAMIALEDIGQKAYEEAFDAALKDGKPNDEAKALAKAARKAAKKAAKEGA